MDEATIKKIMVTCYHNKDYTNLINQLPYEIRYSLFMGDVERNYMRVLYGDVLEYLFTSDEAEILYKQLEDKDKKSDLTILLSENTKMSMIETVELSSYIAKRFVASIKNDNSKFLAACTFLKRHLFAPYTIPQLLTEFKEETKFQLLDVILDNYNVEPHTISEYNYVDILKAFHDENKLTIFTRIIEKHSNKVYSSYQISKVLHVLPENDRKECLIYLLDKFLDSYKASSFPYTAEILSEFKEEEYLDILTIILNRQLIKKYDITSLLDQYTLEQSQKFVDYLLEYEKHNNNNDKLVIDYTIAKLLDKASREDGVKIYKKYAIDTPGFNNLNIALNCRDVETRYFYIDYLLSVVKPKSFDDAFEIIDASLAQMSEIPSGNNEYPHIIAMYAKRHDVNKEHLREFIRRFNYTTFRFLISKNVKQIINLPDAEFNKIINIFSHGQMLDNNMINTICNSFLQREFRLVNEQDYTIFAQFENILAHKDEQTASKVTEMLSEINNVVDINAHLNKNSITYDQLIAGLISDDTNAITILHDITQEYIMKKRETFVKDKLTTVYDELDVNKKIEKSLFKKLLIEQSSAFDINFTLSTIPQNVFNEEEKGLLDNRELLDRLFNFKKNQTPLQDQSEKRFLKIFESLLNKIYEHKYKEDKFSDIENLQYTYSPKEPDDEWLLGIIVDLNVEQLVKKVINDKETYDELIKFIEKYQILGWGNTFKTFEDKADITINDGAIASLISNFYIIHATAKEKNANLTQYIDYANCYNSLSKIYSLILEQDNYRAIAANEGKNKAQMSKTERLSRLPRLITDMYSRQEITTPPIDKDYDISTGKKVNVVMGNSTNMINLSYGERTNSCLRIGGAFNDLFEFCVRDKNGFHVRFSDPETGKFITRVSGLRNGNTLFFNELRDCENPNYTNEEIIEILKVLSDEIIEQTKDEECPIENVVITYDYAMSDYENEAIPSQLSQYPNAFFGKHFNITLDGKFVLLKSTHPNGELMPYKFGENLAKTYATQRDKIQIISNPERAHEKITQIHYIDEILKGTEIDSLPTITKTDVVMCITGEDWYVYQDSNGNIHQYIMENSKHKDRALGEMKSALEQIKSLREEQSQSKLIGG